MRRTHLSLFVMLCLGASALGCGAAATKTAALSKPPVDLFDRDGDGILDAEDKDPSAPSTPSSPAKAKAPSPTPSAEPRSQEEGRDEDQAQKIVYSAKITMAVFQVEQGLRTVESLARNMGGFLAQKHDREITIRVPRARFEPTLVSIDKIGDVLHRDVEAEDVSESYVDLEVRITNARTMQTRLRLLLDKAAVKEALEIEKELARVTQELELLEGKMKALKDRITFSTITVRFEPRASSGVEARTKLPFPWLHELGLPTLLTLEEAK